jgi:anti-sigma factor ChrR (cupin superfamily)
MINLDFKKRVVIHTHQQDWQASPMPHVWRKPLAREETEHGHATSIVRYEPGASFSEHGHPLGEEIFVLEGTFSDQTGDYPAGTYFRNPEGFRHAPFSKQGTLILVKLHQFQEGDDQHVVVDTNTVQWQPGPGKRSVLPLHGFKREHVSLECWPAGERSKPQSHVGGEEIYVVKGELIDSRNRYPAGTWIRSPHGTVHTRRVEQDTVLWVKTGHLDTNPSLEALNG